MGISRKRACVLPRGWTADKYWDEIDQVIQAEPEAKVLFQDGPYYRQDRNLFPPLRWVKRGGKYVVAMPSKEAAEYLRQKLDDIPSKLWLRQTVAAVRGDLQQSVKRAYQAKRCTAHEAAEDLEALIERTEALASLSREKENLFTAWLVVGYRNRKELAAYRAEHGEDAAVSVRRPSGSAWRLTWFDPETQKRNQASMGDIFIVYPMGSPETIGCVRQAEIRGARSDAGRAHIICENSIIQVIDREK